MARKAQRGDGVVAENRKARYNYAIEDTVEAGIVLLGSEVKSLRNGQANIANSYAEAKEGQISLINAYIPAYAEANRFGHEERRPRRLLLHLREIAKLAQAINREGMTLIPLKVYFNDRGIAKMLLGIAKGKKAADKRETEKKRDWDREKSRLLREKG